MKKGATHHDGLNAPLKKPVIRGGILIYECANLVIASFTLFDYAFPLVITNIPLLDYAFPLVITNIPLLDYVIPVIFTNIPLLDYIIPVVFTNNPLLASPLSTKTTQ
jgi:hypothetical protein